MIVAFVMGHRKNMASPYNPQSLECNEALPRNVFGMAQKATNSCTKVIKHKFNEGKLCEGKCLSSIDCQLPNVGT